jgi:hypothetical protein
MLVVPVALLTVLAAPPAADDHPEARPTTQDTVPAPTDAEAGRPQTTPTVDEPEQPRTAVGAAPTPLALDATGSRF